MPPNSIPGYTYGTDAVAKSPLSLEDLRRLEQSAGLTPEDDHYLRMAGDILEDQADAVIDAWRSIIGSQPHLAHYFVGPGAKPDDHYKAAVKKRFAQWVLDTCRRPRDRAWLDYQEEIALRHTAAKKNRTDNAHTPPFIPLRYVLVFGGVVTTTMRPFLSKKGHTPDKVEHMLHAWSKAVFLQLTLWARPYTQDGQW